MTTVLKVISANLLLFRKTDCYNVSYTLLYISMLIAALKQWTQELAPATFCLSCLIDYIIAWISKALNVQYVLDLDISPSCSWRWYPFLFCLVYTIYDCFSDMVVFMEIWLIKRSGIAFQSHLYKDTKLQIFF